MTSGDPLPWLYSPTFVPNAENPHASVQTSFVNPISGIDSGATLKKIGVYRELTGITAISVGLSDGRKSLYPADSDVQSRSTVYNEFIFHDSELITQLSLWPSVANPQNFLGRIRFETSGIPDGSGNQASRVFDSGKQVLPRPKIGDTTGLDITDASWEDAQGQGVPNDYGRTIDGRFVVTLANLAGEDTEVFRRYDYDRDTFGIERPRDNFYDENEVGVDVGSGICVGILGGSRVYEPSNLVYVGSVAFAFMKPVAFATVEVEYPLLEDVDVANSFIISELVASRRFSRVGASTVDASTPGVAGTSNFDDISKFPRDSIPDGQHVYTVNELETWTHMPWLALAAGAKIIVPRTSQDSPSKVQMLNQKFKINLSATSYTTRPRRQNRDIAWSNTITVPRGKVVQTSVYAQKAHIQTFYLGKLRVDFLEPNPDGTFNSIFIGARGWSTTRDRFTPVPWQGNYEAIKYGPFLYEDTDDHGNAFLVS